MSAQTLYFVWTRKDTLVFAGNYLSVNSIDRIVDEWSYEKKARVDSEEMFPNFVFACLLYLNKCYEDHINAGVMANAVMSPKTTKLFTTLMEYKVTFNAAMAELSCIIPLFNALEMERFFTMQMIVEGPPPVVVALSTGEQLTGIRLDHLEAGRARKRKNARAAARAAARNSLEVQDEMLEERGQRMPDDHESASGLSLIPSPTQNAYSQFQSMLADDSTDPEDTELADLWNSFTC